MSATAAVLSLFASQEESDVYLRLLRPTMLRERPRKHFGEGGGIVLVQGLCVGGGGEGVFERGREEEAAQTRALRLRSPAGGGWCARKKSLQRQQ